MIAFAYEARQPVFAILDNKVAPVTSYGQIRGGSVFPLQLYPLALPDTGKSA